jgi:tetrahydromethanopterin S-methyltransferase subunit G
MALAPTDDALNALTNASNLMPFSDDLSSAKTRLSDVRSRIMVASSQAEVADEFSGMMLAGLDDDSAARVSAGGGSCSYSTGETIAIVIGLILGIIPGLILLVLLC